MFLQQPWCSEELIERACRRAGLQDFGDTQFRGGLQVFLRACAEEAELSLFGHLGTRWDIERLLITGNYGGGYGGGYGWGGVAAGVAAGAVVGAAATAAYPSYYPVPTAAPYCPYPDYPNCGL